jgi:hypothetical protein
MAFARDVAVKRVHVLAVACFLLHEIIFIRKCGTGLFLIALAPVLLWAGAPGLWTERGVITSGATPDDYSRLQ